MENKSAFGIVIPTYNRQENLRTVLESLATQTYQDFSVTVADDGSTDGTRELIDELQETRHWKGRLHWIWCGVNRGIRPGRARNIGVSSLPKHTFCLLLDSDVILESHAVERVLSAHNQWPSAIIFGLVNWLPPMARSKLIERWRTGGFVALEESIPISSGGRVHGTYVGPDLRLALTPSPFSSQPSTPVYLRAEWALSALLGCPVELYRSIEGFNEDMDTYGYDDIEFGARAQANGVSGLFLHDILGMHIWHPKPDPDESVIEEQKNLDYVLRLHGPNPALGKNVDWIYWWHYHRDRGGTLIRIGSQLWAINAQQTRRIQLPQQDWVTRLGHSNLSITASSEEVLASIPECPAIWSGQRRQISRLGEKH